MESNAMSVIGFLQIKNLAYGQICCCLFVTFSIVKSVSNDGNSEPSMKSFDFHNFA
jgi:hypothetical protein